MMKIKVKCRTEEEYRMIKSYMDTIGVDYRQKEGKSLKLDCNENEMRNYLYQLNINPVFVKPCKSQKDKPCITGYRAINRGDGHGLQEEYSLQSVLHQMLSNNPIRSKDDLDTCRALIDLMDPSGLTRAVFEHSKKSFNFDLDDNEDYEY